jgi:hypothetical protein
LRWHFSCWCYDSVIHYCFHGRWNKCQSSIHASTKWVLQVITNISRSQEAWAMHLKSPFIQGLNWKFSSAS